VAADTPIVCDPNAISPPQRERWMQVASDLYRFVEDIQELADGYALRLPADASVLVLAAEHINFERLCCPLMRYSLEVEPNGGPFWLRLTGDEAVKELFWTSFASIRRC
jgi:hypothetical protein